MIMLDNGSVLLVNCRIFDGTGEEEIPSGAIWIDGEEIRRVGPMDQFGDIDDDVQRIDVGGRFVMPGLTEAHSHLSTSMRPACRTWT
jgi:imidazolonepropionase-like amidohydrolase